MHNDVINKGDLLMNYILRHAFYKQISQSKVSFKKRNIPINKKHSDAYKYVKKMRKVLFTVITVKLRTSSFLLIVLGLCERS